LEGKAIIDVSGRRACASIRAEAASGLDGWLTDRLFGR
jgi:hypothetical protein